MMSRIEAICTAKAIGDNLRAEGKSYQAINAWAPCYAGWDDCVAALGQSRTLSYMTEGFKDE